MYIISKTSGFLISIKCLQNIILFTFYTYKSEVKTHHHNEFIWKFKPFSVTRFVREILARIHKI